jgi:hypothetical protein
VTRGLGTTLGMVNRAVLAVSEREKKEREKSQEYDFGKSGIQSFFFLYLNFDFDVPNILLIS